MKSVWWVFGEYLRKNAKITWVKATVFPNFPILARKWERKLKK